MTPTSNELTTTNTPTNNPTNKDLKYIRSAPVKKPKYTFINTTLKEIAKEDIGGFLSYQPLTGTRHNEIGMTKQFKAIGPVKPITDMSLTFKNSLLVA
jgi:hypothetical protein